jgi:uncharacterized protein YhfF
MIVNKQKTQFQPVSFTFDNEQELNDVVAALAAYGRKSASVASTSIASDLKLPAYSGNARRTVNALLGQFAAATQR